MCSVLYISRSRKFVCYVRNFFVNRFPELSVQLIQYSCLCNFILTSATPFKFGKFLRPVYTGDFCCYFSGDFSGDFTAISNRPCKLLAIPRRFESPVVYTGDFAAILAAILAAISWRFHGDFKSPV